MGSRCIKTYQRPPLLGRLSPPVPRGFNSSPCLPFLLFLFLTPQFKRAGGLVVAQLRVSALSATCFGVLRQAAACFSQQRCQSSPVRGAVVELAGTSRLKSCRGLVGVLVALTALRGLCAPVLRTALMPGRLRKSPECADYAPPYLRRPPFASRRRGSNAEDQGAQIQKDAKGASRKRRGRNGGFFVHLPSLNLKPGFYTSRRIA